MYVLVNKCKEKWKNLRTSFVRKIKNSTSGSKAKKTYYLNEAMQFTLPFVKTRAIPSGNLSPIPDEDFETADMLENSEITEYLESIQTDSTSVSSPNMILPLSSHPSTFNSIPLITTQPETEHAITPEPIVSKFKSTPRKKVKNNKNSSTDVDKAFTEYFETKKAKLDTTASDTRTDSVKQFLHSIIPDLLTMSDSQLSTYKRKSIELIDEILCSPPVNCHSSVATYLSSFSSDESTVISNYTNL